MNVTQSMLLYCRRCEMLKPKIIIGTNSGMPGGNIEPGISQYTWQVYDSIPVFLVICKLVGCYITLHMPLDNMSKYQ